MSDCPYCGEHAETGWDEVAHMERRHPGVIFSRLTRAGMHDEAAKFAGPRPTDWQLYARWQLGEITDELYAETLAGDPDAETLRDSLLRA